MAGNVPGGSAQGLWDKTMGTSASITAAMRSSAITTASLPYPQVNAATALSLPD